MEEWVAEELEYVDLDDERLDLRMGKVLEGLSGQPSLSIPTATACRSEMTAAYRFFSNKKVTFESVIESHLEKSRERLSEHNVLLLVGDTTEISNKRPKQNIEGIGYLDSKRRGSLLHCLCAFSEAGVPLGLLSADLNHRQLRKKTPKPNTLPIEKKESYRWLSNQLVVKELSEELPNAHFISIYDSEADIFEVLSAFQDKQAKSDYIIRAYRNRKLSNEAVSLKDKVLAAPVKFKTKLAIRNRTKRIKCNTDKRDQDRKARTSTFEVRATTVSLEPPAHLKICTLAQVVNVVSVREAVKQQNENRIEWVLLTTLPIDSKMDIEKIIQHYCKRWSIEIYFKILKSGCQIENRQFQSINTFEPCLALYLIIAWRILYITKFAREYPEAACDLVFTESEWKALYVTRLKKRPPNKAPSIYEMLICVAQLGGYIVRKKSPPGPQTIWIGMQRLHDLALAWDAFNSLR